MKNKGFIFLFVVFVISGIADFVSTIRLGELATILESNPLFSTLGFTGLVTLNLVVFFVVYKLYHYKKTTSGWRFYMIHVMILNIIMRAVAIKNAMSMHDNPIPVEAARIMATEAVKQQFYVTSVLAIITPFFVGLLTFLFWRLDHDIERKDKE